VIIPVLDITYLDVRGSIDKLDAATNLQPSATYVQPEENEQVAKAPQLIENVGGPARIRTLDQRIMSSPEGTGVEEDKSLSPAKQGKVRQNPQPGRNRDAGEESR
jgi:hypothetical protein